MGREGLRTSQEKTRKPRKELFGVVTEGRFRRLGKVVFGYKALHLGREYLALVRITPLGSAQRTGELMRCDHAKFRRVLRNKGIVGIAESTYPHPRGWTFEQVNERVTLQNMTVKLLTGAFRRKNSRPPLAEAKWDATLNRDEGDTPWSRVWRNLRHPASSNRDIKCRMRVLHRSVRLRIWTDKEAKCRMCGCGRDTFSHWPVCSVLAQAFSIEHIPNHPSGIILGIDLESQPLVGSAALLHNLIWKFALINFTQVDLEDKKFDPEEVQPNAKRRLLERMLAYWSDLKVELKKREAKGHTDVKEIRERANRNLHPFARIGEDMKLGVNEGLLRAVAEEGAYKGLERLKDVEKRDSVKIGMTYIREEGNGEAHSWIQEEEVKMNKFKNENAQFVKRKYR